jgi:hypothetical protein
MACGRLVGKADPFHPNGAVNSAPWFFGEFAERRNLQNIILWFWYKIAAVRICRRCTMGAVDAECGCKGVAVG